MSFEKGFLFHNRYQLVAKLGEGASAEVWKARDVKANNLIVAIKIFSENTDIDTYGLQNFEREFTSVYNMSHSNLLPPKSYDIYNGRPYLVMPFCENGSCSGMEGKMEEEDIIKFLHDVAAGLEYLHDHNIIHMDVKPDNVLIDDNCNYVLTDFGISVNTDNGIYDSNGMSGGTRAYMGPERFEGTTVNASDLWSLGATAVELLTGDAPYGDHGGLLQTQGEPLPELPNLQPEVSSIIMSCLSADPRKRIKANEIRRKIELYWETGSWVRHSNKNLIAIGVTSVACIIACVGIFLWDYNRTKVRYYKDYVEEWSVPKGVGRLSPFAAKHMNRMYRFEYSKGKVRNVAHVNSRGKIIDDDESERRERPLNQDIYYSSEGKVSRIKVMDRNGKVLYVKAFNENLSTMAFQYDDEHNTERAIEAKTVGYGRMLESSGEKKGKISRWWIEYDEKGHITTIRYAGLDNSQVGDENNIYGRTMTYDKKGRVAEIHYINKDGQPISTKWGLGIKKFFYDSDDNWIRAEYYTVDGLPAYDDIDGVSIYEMKYDERGNVVMTMHLDGDGELMLPKKSSVAGILTEYDDNGFQSKVVYLDVNYEPTYVPNTGASGLVMKYDENGYVNEYTYIDTDGNPCESMDGCSTIRLKNDERGNAIEGWYYDTQGELCLNSDAIAGMVRSFDERGNLKEQIYYGKDSIPCISSGGEYGLRYAYDDKDLLTEIVSLNEDLNPGFDNDHRCIIRFEYDKRGNLTKIAYYDESGTALVKSSENVAGWNMSYDDLGNETERTFFNEKNEPCVIFGSYAKVVYTYDANGHIASQKYYGLDGKLTLYNSIAGTEYTCDERGNVLVLREIGKDGRAASGRLEMRCKYDEFDNTVEIAFYNANGKAASNYDGYHRRTYKYDSRNQPTETRYYNVNGKLTLTKEDGVAVITMEYDNKGNKVRQNYFGTDGKPIKGKEGYASSTYEYDVFGNIIKQCFYAVDGKPSDPKDMVPVGICQYDKRNNIIFLAAQDGYGKYIVSPQIGFAIMRAEYDDASNELWEAYYDENDKPMHYNGYHKEVYKYNDRGKLESTELFDKNGRKVNCTAGYQKMVVSYDDTGEPAKRKYYTVGGTLLATETYNKQAGSWELSGYSSGYSSSYDSGSDWLSTVRSVASQCPQEFDNNVWLKSVTYTSSSVALTIKLSDVSKYNCDEEEIMNNFREMRRDLRDALGLPSNVSLRLIVVDKADRTICTL